MPHSKVKTVALLLALSAGGWVAVWAADKIPGAIRTWDAPWWEGRAAGSAAGNPMKSEGVTWAVFDLDRSKPTEWSVYTLMSWDGEHGRWQRVQNASYSKNNQTLRGGGTGEHMAALVFTASRSANYALVGRLRCKGWSGEETVAMTLRIMHFEKTGDTWKFKRDLHTQTTGSTPPGGDMVDLGTVDSLRRFELSTGDLIVITGITSHPNHGCYIQLAADQQNPLSVAILR